VAWKQIGSIAGKAFLIHLRDQKLSVTTKSPTTRGRVSKTRDMHLPPYIQVKSRAKIGEFDIQSFTVIHS